MKKPYGYKLNDLIALAKLIQNRKGKSLSSVFEDYSLKTGKAKGTVRNVYYALVKHSQEDLEFREKYLGNVPLCANKIIQFDKSEEKWLLAEIEKGVKEGSSVRAIINDLANGDVKRALRYQNKYRSIIAKQGKNKVQIKTLKPTHISYQIPKTSVAILRREINSLMEKLLKQANIEKQKLLLKISSLEEENARLTKLLDCNKPQKVLEYFSSQSLGKTLNS